tara:strand:- start:615 stop:1121 length:507 start_codon:yes stop_codon:yes gene_type:complete
MIVIQTRRLFIELASTKDAPFFWQLMNSNNWLEFIGDRGIRSKKEAGEYIRKSLMQSYDQNGYGLYKMTLKENNVPIGICGFIKRQYLDHPDIGFALLPDYEGFGYMREAAAASLAYGSDTLGLNPVLAVTTENNVRSRRLLEKIGLRKIGTITPPERSEDFMLFSKG